MSESDQCLYDTAFYRFRELCHDFKILHRLKYVQYIVRIEGRFAKLSSRIFQVCRHEAYYASGYPSSVFLRNDCARDLQSIADLFAGVFFKAYTCGMVESRVVTCEISGFSGLRRQQKTRPGRNCTSYFETVAFGCQISFDIRF
jgi:hypothetical protein